MRCSLSLSGSFLRPRVYLIFFFHFIFVSSIRLLHFATIFFTSFFKIFSFSFLQHFIFFFFYSNNKTFFLSIIYLKLFRRIFKPSFLSSFLSLRFFRLDLMYCVAKLCTQSNEEKKNSLLNQKKNFLYQLINFCSVCRMNSYVCAVKTACSLCNLLLICFTLFFMDILVCLLYT